MDFYGRHAQIAVTCQASEDNIQMHSHCSQLCLRASLSIVALNSCLSLRNAQTTVIWHASGYRISIRHYSAQEQLYPSNSALENLYGTCIDSSHLIHQTICFMFLGALYQSTSLCMAASCVGHKEKIWALPPWIQHCHTTLAALWYAPEGVSSAWAGLFPEARSHLRRATCCAQEQTCQCRHRCTYFPKLCLESHRINNRTASTEHRRHLDAFDTNHTQQSHTTLRITNHTQQSHTTLRDTNHAQQSHTALRDTNHTQKITHYTQRYQSHTTIPHYTQRPNSQKSAHSLCTSVGMHRIRVALCTLIKTFHWSVKVLGHDSIGSPESGVTKVLGHDSIGSPESWVTKVLGHQSLGSPPVIRTNYEVYLKNAKQSIVATHDCNGQIKLLQPKRKSQDWSSSYWSNSVQQSSWNTTSQCTVETQTWKPRYHDETHSHRSKIVQPGDYISKRFQDWSPKTHDTMHSGKTYQEKGLSESNLMRFKYFRIGQKAWSID